MSAVLGSNEVMGVFTPGTHGSTFGGNPVATALGKAVCDELATGRWQAHAEELHPVLFDGLRALLGRGLTEVRGVALWAGVDIDPAVVSGSLLLKSAKVLGPNGVRQGYYGQDINLTTYNLARINMFLHDVNYDKFNIAHGDTLIDPQHWDGQPCEAIVSNPPLLI